MLKSRHSFMNSPKQAGDRIPDYFIFLMSQVEVGLNFGIVRVPDSLDDKNE